MTTPVKKRNHAKFCEFHGEVGHNTDECMNLRKQTEEMLKAGMLSYLVKEIKQNNGKDLDEFHGREITMSADVARSHGGDGRGEDRPSPHHVPSGCMVCFANR
nr:retrotransposon Gag domain-containing protein [Tanacetum cinerariifolium]